MKLIVAVWMVALFACTASGNEPAPELPSSRSQWLDEKTLQMNQLKGKVVLMNVWTFGCWNSYRSLPWVVSLEKRFPELQIIGIHTPEFDHEKDRTQLRKTMKSYNVSYPQLLDEDMTYWRQLNNHYWPSFYVIDKQGRIRGRFIGETHNDDAQAARIEKMIAGLLKEGDSSDYRKARFGSLLALFLAYMK